MITEIENVAVLTEIGGGVNETCAAGVNGVEVGLITFTGVAGLGLLVSFVATMLNCCYRGWNNANDVQKGIDEGGGRLGGYWGRLFLRMAVGRCCDVIGGFIFVGTIGVGMALVGTVGWSNFVRDSNSSCINGSTFSA